MTFDVTSQFVNDVVCALELKGRRLAKKGEQSGNDMSRVFQTKLVEEERGDEVRYRWALPAAGFELLEAVAAPFKMDAQAFLAWHAQSFVTNDEEFPWAIIVFEQELPLSGHVARIRGVKGNMPLHAFSILTRGVKSVAPGCAPRVSTISVRRKAILKTAAEQSLLFRPAWEALKDRAEDKPWFCFSDPPPADWVAATAVGDDALFFQYRRRGQTHWRDPASLKNRLVSGNYTTGLDAYACKNWAVCAKAMLDVVTAEPDIPEAWHMLGCAMLYFGKVDGALDAFRFALDMEPLWMGTLIGVAICLARQGEFIEGITFLDKVLEIDPFDEDAWRRKALMHWKGKQAERAIAAFRRLLELNPGDADGWDKLGEILWAQNQDSESIEAMENAIRLGGESAMLWNNIGFLHARNHRIEQAVQACGKALELDPKLHTTWDSLGYAHLMANDYEKAVPKFLKAIELKSDFPDAWRHLLHAYKRSGQEGQFNSARAYATNILPKEVAAVDAEILTDRIS